MTLPLPLNRRLVITVAVTPPAQPHGAASAYPEAVEATDADLARLNSHRTQRREPVHPLWYRNRH